MTDIITRRMQAEDLAEGLRLTQAESWAYRLEDWSFHYRVGRGWIACDAGGRVLGTALWWPYGDRFATVGLVIVDRNQQGKGIGRRLMNAVMEDAGTRSLQLVATRAGTRLYEQCGFREQSAIHQRQGIPTGIARAGETGEAGLRPVVSADVSTIGQWDSQAFGTDRTEIIATVLESGKGVLAARGGRLCGYALARPAGRGTTIGPVVAEDERLAIELIARLLQRGIGGFTRLDVPADATALGNWLESAGIVQVDHAAVMVRGTPPTRGGPARVFGLVSQALT
ncbi:MAG: GNAT family N-acetyltransferase [Gammaproteobacteria bacterium]|nr:GNAT family N-acetyltransferase [Gammaproteobacteria bacterium]